MLIPCQDLDRAQRLLTTELGFRVDAVFRADDPAIIVLSGYGESLWLVRRDVERPDMDSEFKLLIPPLDPAFVLQRRLDDADWHEGRVREMLYRDLIPGRQGGRFIASHIRIPNGGIVQDPVHFHRVRFQMIYCYKGWVRLAYEDQGNEFVMSAGDCVLQPPEIRHQVKESSPGLEVIEICCPADHWTFYDHDVRLPTPSVVPDREFSRQRFIFHEARTAEWHSWRIEGFEARDTGIFAATRGVAAANIVRANGTGTTRLRPGNSELLFFFVLQGSLNLHRDNETVERLSAGASVVVPGGMLHSLSAGSMDLEFLEVTMPGAMETAPRK